MTVQVLAAKNFSDFSSVVGCGSQNAREMICNAESLLIDMINYYSYSYSYIDYYLIAPLLVGFYYILHILKSQCLLVRLQEGISLH